MMAFILFAKTWNMHLNKLNVVIFPCVFLSSSFIPLNYGQ